MAFLQRMVNGGGRVEREFAAGRSRVDLAVLYGGVWTIIEIKLIHPGDGREATVEEGLRQITRYRDTIDCVLSSEFPGFYHDGVPGITAGNSRVLPSPSNT